MNRILDIYFVGGFGTVQVRRVEAVEGCGVMCLWGCAGAPVPKACGWEPGRTEQGGGAGHPPDCRRPEGKAGS